MNTNFFTDSSYFAVKLADTFIFIIPRLIFAAIFQGEKRPFNHNENNTNQINQVPQLILYEANHSDSNDYVHTEHDPNEDRANQIKRGRHK